ncbi:valine--tRNA ligase [Segetibacter sp. 3557_3]|uniref:valine--tRNA ligase n=1 Tax=Segetibacter sp. 3557_3 TaxID=2547429 RepID=UPI001058E4B6|nr:valine--tRNA ligase [Segetibacter sp. 3557_3]TDH29001.1 valine--tRNA ligase [Segetibacter sp. 3557_3]
MTELSKNYLPAETEGKWYSHWLQKKYFSSVPDERTPYTIVIPPPNVTGVLHMGHTLNETVQDILIRRAKMKGYNTCWVPGSDHASIATESKVVQMLKEKGIDKSTLSRAEFLEYAFEWKDKYGGIIYDQIAKLGCSVDWDRVTFTMDDHYYKAVIKVFIDLYEKGLIYRGARMINWDPAAKTALSDEEVEHKEIQGTLYYLSYKVVDQPGDGGSSGDTVIIATQRPETIMGDTAICVNPNDERYAHLKGKYAIVPLIDRPVPFIFDEYVDPSFGTGALKVTPAHDINDYNLGLRHGLEVIDTLNPDGTLSPAARIFVGADRFEARKKIIVELREKGYLVKEEVYQTRVGYSQRSGAVVEPRISTQWFLKMKEMAEPALNAVVDGDIKIHPGEKFLATYKYWLENVKDWCISRQLWWGQQIPAWYAPDGKFVVAATHEEAVEKFNQVYPGVLTNKELLKQDEDVLDTWFSSWLWPMEVFNGISDPGNKDVSYYYPTSVLVTGQDIIFFWVARMIMAGMHYNKTRPFADVYFTGMVRDKLGRKMSKSLGNSPDLLALIDKYGADAVRFGIMISSPAGNDLLFDESSLEQGRNFNNKLWNALKLVKMWEQRIGAASTPRTNPGEEHFAVQWFAARLEQVKVELDGAYSQFRLSEGLKTIYSLIWDDFCSWYLEWVKPGFEQPIDQNIYHQTLIFFEELMQLLHPFMPFITEEIYHQLRKREDDLCVKLSAATKEADQSILDDGNQLKKVITALRDARVKNGLKPKEPIKVHIQTADAIIYQKISSILNRQLNIGSLAYTQEPIPVTLIVAVEGDRIFIETETKADTSAVRTDLLKDLDHQQQFLQSVAKKLSNERFMANAKPEIVALERKKQADAEARIKAIEESLASL